MMKKLLLASLVGGGIYGTDLLNQIDNPTLNSAAESLGIKTEEVSDAPPFFESGPIETKISNTPKGCIDTENARISPLSSKCR
jgi:hypothetical protein